MKSIASTVYAKLYFASLMIISECPIHLQICLLRDFFRSHVHSHFVSFIHYWQALATYFRRRCYFLL